MKIQDGRKIRKDVTPTGLAGRLERSGVTTEKVKQALTIMEKSKRRK